MMTKKSTNEVINCAYLLGGTVPHFDQSYSSVNPRTEFQEFIDRNAVTAFDYSRLPKHCEPIVARILKPKFQFALHSRDWRRISKVAIASGEDIGVLCALFDWITGSQRPLVIITHGSYMGSIYWKHIANILKKQQHVHWACLSSSVADAMINEFGFSVSCVHSCGYGVDTDYFSPRYAKADKPMILAAGTANRDYKTLISAVQDLDVDLHIAADSAWYPVETNAHGLDLPSNVTLKSAGDYAGLRQLYSKCRFVVVPMLPAKFACGFAVIAEAMAMGKPVIATRTDALSDFIHEGETGFLVDVGDVSGLRERIQWMIKHPEIVDSMGNFARRMMQEKWSLPAYCERLESAVIAASDEFRRGTERNTIGSKLYVESNATG